MNMQIGCSSQPELKNDSRGPQQEDELTQERQFPNYVTQCYKVKKKSFWGRVKTAIMKPRTSNSKNQNDNLSQYIVTKYDEDAVAAAAFASIPEAAVPACPETETDIDVTDTECSTRYSFSTTSTNGTNVNSASSQINSKKARKKKGKTIYIGDYNEYGNPNGNGDLVWSNGDRYVGEFFNGKRHGQGTLYFFDGSDYTGEWECNYMHGQGTRHFANGDVYVGKYVDGKRSGVGKFYFATGDCKYHGNWSNDQIHGFGQFHYLCNSSLVSFEGIFKNGKRHGLGRMNRQSGEVDVYFYDCNQRTYPGVRWSKDRSQAWKIINGGKVMYPMSIDEAISLGLTFKAQEDEKSLCNLLDH